MKTFAVVTGATTFVLAHHVVKVCYDTTLKSIVLTDSLGKEHLLNGKPDEAFQLIGKIVNALNSGVVPPSEPKQPIEEDLCASCGMSKAEIDGLCQSCYDVLAAEKQSFNGPTD